MRIMITECGTPTPKGRTPIPPLLSAEGVTGRAMILRGIRSIRIVQRAVRKCCAPAQTVASESGVRTESLL
jgi:hypothetical protein